MGVYDSLLCLDIETFPDEQIAPPDLDPALFPKLTYHSIAAISFVECMIERPGGGPERYKVTACRSGKGSTEYELIAGFWNFFQLRQPRLVTWNGRGFDMLVLKLRAMVYGIPALGWYQPGTKWDSYGQRYAVDWHCDLMEVLSDHGASRDRLSLDAFCKATGFPGKLGTTGGDVARMMAEGRQAEVRDYCETDCLNLFLAYLRWALLSGRTDAEGHNASVDSLLEFMRPAYLGKPNFREFLGHWARSTRPAAWHVPPRSVEGIGMCPVCTRFLPDHDADCPNAPPREEPAASLERLI